MKLKVYYVSEGTSLAIEVVKVRLEAGLGDGLKYKQALMAELSLQYLGKYPDRKLLEISSRTPKVVGNALRGSRLLIRLPDQRQVCVKVAYLASQKFSHGGPYLDLLELPYCEASLDIRLKRTGQLTGFCFGREKWQKRDGRYFYEWLYIRALHEQDELTSELLTYDSFSKVSYHAKIWPYCDAKVVALYVLLQRRGLLEKALKSMNSFIMIVRRVRYINEENILQQAQ